uniref:Uncharacterized protein n=1 Tax=Anguilla anguilla TaxID=7936 RepID=A0A0E9S832_ANGAN
MGIGMLLKQDFAPEGNVAYTLSVSLLLWSVCLNIFPSFHVLQ